MVPIARLGTVNLRIFHRPTETVGPTEITGLNLSALLGTSSLRCSSD